MNDMNKPIEKICHVDYPYIEGVKKIKKTKKTIKSEEFIEKLIGG